MNHPPASANTTAYYIRRAQQLVSQASPDGEDISLEELVEFMLEYRYRVCKNTVNQYYVCLLYALEQGALPVVGTTQENIKWAKEILKTADLSVCPPPTHTSATRRKRVAEAHFLAIRKALIADAGRERKNDVANRADYFLVASLATGLRPIEWANAYLDEKDHQYYVHTRTAKLDEDAYRDIPINSSEDVEAIRQHLTLLAPHINDGPQAVQRYITSCRSRLRRTVIKLFGPEFHLVLYDCRHQFTANQRGAGVEGETLKKLLGHISYRTTRIYGRKASSWCGTPIAQTRRRSTPSKPVRESLRP